MNLTKSEKVRLGAFLLSGTVILAGSLVTLAGLKLWERRDIYYISFEESVTGLEPSAAVRYQGLRIGRVDALMVDPNDPSTIRATISLEPETPLFEGTRAVLDMSGLTGLKTINLTAGNPRSPHLKVGSVIPAEASFIGKIGDRAELISERIEVVTQNLASWTGPANRVRVERFIDDTDQLIRNIDATIVEARGPMIAALEEVTRSGAAVRHASDEATLTLKDVRGELRQTLVTANKAMGEAERILAAIDSKTVSDTVKSANSAMSSLDKQLNAEAFKRTFTDLQEALTNVTRLVQSLDLTVRASREDLVLSLKYVRQATEDLREFSRIIAQDPSVLLRGTEVGE